MLLELVFFCFAATVGGIKKMKDRPETQYRYAEPNEIKNGRNWNKLRTHYACVCNVENEMRSIGV